MQYLDLTLPTVFANVALDEALVVSAEEGYGGAILRVWELGHPAVVLGASGRIGEDVDVEACRADGVPIARRSSGGGTVVIGPGALNFAVVVPIDADPEFRSVDRAQVAILGRAAEALRACGPDVRVLGSGDLTIGGRKFSGSAQRRLKGWMLVHASLLYDASPGVVARYTRLPRKQPDYRAGRSHDRFLTNIPLPGDVIKGALRVAWPGDEGPFDPPLGLAARLLLDKFGRDDWIGRL